jgi:Response regulators consisting of a CheY-like receiver domain and a winged-helix DNA-binding domain
MAKTTENNTILILDDEPASIMWMVDYFYDKGVEVYPVSTANDAIKQVNSEIYRAAVIDLNVPILPPFDELQPHWGGVYTLSRLICR